MTTKTTFSKQYTLHRWGLTVPGFILDILGWRAGDKLRYTVSDGRLIVEQAEQHQTNGGDKPWREL